MPAARSQDADRWSSTRIACCRATRRSVRLPGCSTGRSPSCRSCRRTAIPIRTGSRPTSHGATPRSSCSRPTITCSACYSARASRWRRWACRRGPAHRPSTRARHGAPSPPITICSGARRRACGSTMPSRRFSASTSGSTPRPPTFAMTASASSWRLPRSARARCSTVSASRCWRPPTAPRRTCLRIMPSGRRAGRAGSSPPIAPMA